MTAPGDATNVGSIIGYLRLDRSDWDRNLDEAEARARRLGETDPRIRIRVDDNGAARRIDELQAELELLRRRLDDVDGAQRRQSGSASESRGAVLGLKDAIILLGAAAVPIGAVLTGAVAGIAPAAGTAVLALLGIKDAWKSGALAGTEFSRQVRGLQGEFAHLKETAAAGMLPGLTTALQELKPLFGPVNQLVATFASQLGQIAAALGPALVRVFSQLQPVFSTFGNVLVTGANRLAAWLQSSDGVKKFGDYIITALPSVLHTLGQLAQLGGHLLTAFAPIGTVVVQALGLVASVLNRIPINVLTGLAAAALTAYAAFKTFAIAVVIIDTVRAAMRSLAAASMGTWIGAILALVGVVAMFAMGMSSAGDQTQAAKQVMDSYADSVKQSTDALNAANQAQIRKNLSDKDAFTQLDELHAKNELLGVSYQDLVEAVAQGGGKMRALARELSAVSQNSGTLNNAAFKLTTTLGSQSVGIHSQINSWEKYNVAVKQGEARLNATDAATARSARTMHATVSAYLAARDAARKNTEQAHKQTIEFQMENDAADLLKGALDRLAGKHISLAEAQNSLDSSLVNMTKHTHVSISALAAMSQSAVQTRGELNAQVQAAEQVAESYGQMTGSAEAGKQKFAELRAQIIQNAIAHGIDRDAVEKYITTSLGIPKSVVTKLQVEKTQAELGLDEIRRELAIMTSTRYDINVYRVNHGSFANLGNNVRAYAFGGTVPGTGSSDTFPAMLTPGEEVIPKKQAERNRRLLKAISAGTVRGYASGGTVGQVPGDTSRFLHSLSVSGDPTGAFRTLLSDANGAGLSGSLADALKREAAALSGIFAARNRTVDTLQAEQGKLEQIRQAAAQERQSVRQAFTGTVDITTTGQVFHDQPATATSILASIGKAAGRARAFASVLRKLKAAGLGNSYLQQLASAGPAALEQAEALLQATPAQVAQLNADYRSIGAAGTSSGDLMAKSLYGAGEQAVEGLIGGLKAKDADLNSAMKHLADVMVGQIKKDLDIHSPSRVLHRLGRFTAEGFANGIRGGVPSVASAAQELTGAAVRGVPMSNRPALAGHFAPVAPEGPKAVVHVHPAASMDETALATAAVRKMQTLGI